MASPSAGKSEKRYGDSSDHADGSRQLNARVERQHTHIGPGVGVRKQGYDLHQARTYQWWNEEPGKSRPRDHEHLIDDHPARWERLRLPNSIGEGGHSCRPDGLSRHESSIAHEPWRFHALVHQDSVVASWLCTEMPIGLSQGRRRTECADLREHRPSMALCRRRPSSTSSTRKDAVAIASPTANRNAIATSCARTRPAARAVGTRTGIGLLFGRSIHARRWATLVARHERQRHLERLQLARSNSDANA